MQMKVGIVGLGLIGGSLARAYKAQGHTVLGADTDKKTVGFVKLTGVIDGELTEGEMPLCDLVLIAIPPSQAEMWIAEHAALFGKNTLVMDCCGTKRRVCEVGFRMMDETDLLYVGAHPMAGRQVWGFKNSMADMFRGATCAVVPRDRSDIRLLEKVKKMLAPLGISKFLVMTADEHDRVIAFTSQMSHLISNAFVKSDQALKEEAEAAGGSFRDMTRVAYLDEHMWTELFLENRDNLLSELDIFMSELERYRIALETEDTDTLTKLLAEGSKRKQEVEAHHAVS